MKSHKKWYRGSCCRNFFCITFTRTLVCIVHVKLTKSGDSCSDYRLATLDFAKIPLLLLFEWVSSFLFCFIIIIVYLLIFFSCFTFTFVSVTDKVKYHLRSNDVWRSSDLKINKSYHYIFQVRTLFLKKWKKNLREGGEKTLETKTCNQKKQKIKLNGMQKNIPPSTWNKCNAKLMSRSV